MELSGFNHYITMTSGSVYLWTGPLKLLAEGKQKGKVAVKVSKAPSRKMFVVTELKK